MRVKDLMTTNIIKVYENETIINCAKLMANNNIGFLPILNKANDVIGVITDRDIVTRAVASNINIYSSINTIMTKNIIATSKNDDISYAISKMADNQVKRIIVLDKKKIVGIISLGDLSKTKETFIYLPDLLKEISCDNIYQSTSLFKDISSPLEI